MSGDATTTSPFEAALLREVDGLRRDFQEHRAETRKAYGELREETVQQIAGLRDEAREELRKLVEQTTATNGRLRRAEQFIAGVKGIGWLLVAATPFAIYLLSTH